MQYTLHSDGEILYAEISIANLRRAGWDLKALLDYLFYEGYYNEANSSNTPTQRQSGSSPTD